MNLPKGAITKSPDCTFKCAVSRYEGRMDVTYDITNESSSNIYVLDAFQTRAPGSPSSRVDLSRYFLANSPADSALVIRGIPPLPANKMVTVRAIPLGTRVLPGKTLQRTFEIKLPLKEQNDCYYAPLKEDEHQRIEVRHLRIKINYIKDDVKGFKSLPFLEGDKFFIVKSENIVGQAREATVSLDVDPTPLLKRADLFSRP